MALEDVSSAKSPKASPNTEYTKGSTTKIALLVSASEDSFASLRSSGVANKVEHYHYFKATAGYENHIGSFASKSFMFLPHN